MFTSSLSEVCLACTLFLCTSLPRCPHTLSAPLYLCPLTPIPLCLVPFTPSASVPLCLRTLSVSLGICIYPCPAHADVSPSRPPRRAGTPPAHPADARSYPRALLIEVFLRELLSNAVSFSRWGAWGGCCLGCVSVFVSFGLGYFLLCFVYLVLVGFVFFWTRVLFLGLFGFSVCFFLLSF